MMTFHVKPFFNIPTHTHTYFLSPLLFIIFPGIIVSTSIFQRLLQIVVQVLICDSQVLETNFNSISDINQFIIPTIPINSIKFKDFSRKTFISCYDTPTRIFSPLLFTISPRVIISTVRPPKASPQHPTRGSISADKIPSLAWKLTYRNPLPQPTPLPPTPLLYPYAHLHAYLHTV